MALLAGRWEVVGGVIVVLCIWAETDAFEEWRCRCIWIWMGDVAVWGLEAPEGASPLPGCADEGVVDVDTEDTVCTPGLS